MKMILDLEVIYTSKKWKCCYESESDSSSFLFSLTNKEKYLLKNINDQYAIHHCDIDYSL